MNTVCPGWIVPAVEDEVGENSFWKRWGYETYTPEAMSSGRPRRGIGQYLFAFSSTSGV